jgi:hypothetical protein
VIERRTIRQFLAARRRKFIIAVIACWLGGFMSMVAASETQRPPSWLVVATTVFFAGVLLAIFAIFFFIRCPRCKGSLGANNAPLVRDHLFARRINFCPYCGVSLDEPYENHSPSRHVGTLA